MTQFKVGDHAVYPGHGVGRIDKIEVKEILGSKHEFYSVVILETGMKVMIPAANCPWCGSDWRSCRRQSDRTEYRRHNPLRRRTSNCLQV